MAASKLDIRPLEEVRSEYTALLRANGMKPSPEEIEVPLSCGRVTYEAVYARSSVPDSHSCAMDGVALASGDVSRASEATPVFLSRERYCPVSTGDRLPDGCDCVVMEEDVIEAPDGIELCRPAVPWQHVRQIGEDVCEGEMLLPSFTYIRPAAVGAMLASGVGRILVCRRPVIGVVAPASADSAADCNYAILSAMLNEWSAVPELFRCAGDGTDAAEKTVGEALSRCDAVVMTGFTSADGGTGGCETVAKFGTVFCRGIAIKPGKPAVLGYSGAKPVICIPEYPVSAIVVVEQILKGIIETLGGNMSHAFETQEATLSKSIISDENCREFVRMRAGCVNGNLVASPLSRGSGIVSSFMKADGIVEVPEGCGGYRTGTQVPVRLLTPRQELERMLVATGSHDRVMDELADLMKRSGCGYALSSSNVGSMGGIMAIRRREAHVAPIHLLDEETGGYNTFFVKKNFPKGGVRLVECVGRLQGLLVKKGNPLGIASFADLAAGGIRYVNRQKGSGTHILCHWLCGRYGIDTSRLRGYEREEFTRMSAAALIASGEADAALGTWFDAGMCGLDFIPVCEEQYDLLIPDSSWELPMVQSMLEVLGSGAFRERILNMGGYSVDSPGRVRERF